VRYCSGNVLYEEERKKERKGEREKVKASKTERKKHHGISTIPYRVFFFVISGGENMIPDEWSVDGKDAVE